MQKNKKIKNNFCPKGGLIQGPLDLKSTALSTHLSCHYIEFGKKILLYTIPVQNREISVFSAVCQLISKKNILYYSTLKRAIFCIYIMFLVH